jgi:ribosomal-protein-alanine N-acetyltransferase
MRAEILVRRFTPAAMDSVLKIERSAFGEWAWDRNLFADYLDSCGALFFTAVRGGRIVGYSITCVSRGLVRKRAELVSIAVAREEQGRGAAEALLRRTVRDLRRREIPRLGLTVKVTNDRARAFYEKHGFRKVRRIPRYYEDGEDGYAYRLDLDQ